MVSGSIAKKERIYSEGKAVSSLTGSWKIGQLYVKSLN